MSTGGSIVTNSRGSASVCPAGPLKRQAMLQMLVRNRFRPSTRRFSPRSVCARNSPSLPVFPRHHVKSREADMRKWAKPRIVEIAIGLEINAYASAEIG